MCKSETQITDLNNDNNRNNQAEGTAILQDHRRNTYCVTATINKAITLINSQILLIFFTFCINIMPDHQQLLFSVHSFMYENRSMDRKTIETFF